MLSDIISIVITVTTNFRELTPEELVRDAQAWQNYKDSVAIFSYAITGVSAILGGGALAAFAYGIFQAYKQAQGIATNIASMVTTRGIGKYKEAVKAEKALEKEEKIATAAKEKEQRETEKGFAHGMRSAGVGGPDIHNMFKNPLKSEEFLKQSGLTGYAIHPSGRHKVDLTSFTVNSGHQWKFAAVNVSKADPINFKKVAENTEEGGEFVAVSKHGVTTRYKKVGDTFFNETHGAKDTQGLSADELVNEYY